MAPLLGVVSILGSSVGVNALSFRNTNSTHIGLGSAVEMIASGDLSADEPKDLSQQGADGANALLALNKKLLVRKFDVNAHEAQFQYKHTSWSFIKKNMLAFWRNKDKAVTLGLVMDPAIPEYDILAVSANDMWSPTSFGLMDNDKLNNDIAHSDGGSKAESTAMVLSKYFTTWFAPILVWLDPLAQISQQKTKFSAAHAQAKAYAKLVQGLATTVSGLTKFHEKQTEDQTFKRFMEWLKTAPENLEPVSKAQLRHFLESDAYDNWNKVPLFAKLFYLGSIAHLQVQPDKDLSERYNHLIKQTKRFAVTDFAFPTPQDGAAWTDPLSEQFNNLIKQTSRIHTVTDFAIPTPHDGAAWTDPLETVDSYIAQKTDATIQKNLDEGNTHTEVVVSTLRCVCVCESHSFTSFAPDVYR